MSIGKRDNRGRFAVGNPGGPGRPRRPVEQEYLATLNAAVTLDTWRQIVQRAVSDAVEGDAKAREWLAKYLMGDEPQSLVQLAADEQAGLTADVAIGEIAFKEQQLAKMLSFRRSLVELLNGSTQTARTNGESSNSKEDAHPITTWCESQPTGDARITNACAST